MIKRPRLSLDGPWDVIFDEHERLGADCFARPDAAPVRVTVPGVWEEARPGYDGQGFYRRRFELPAAMRADGRLLNLRFGAVNYYAEVFLNGVRVGEHEGGYTPFVLDATRAARAGTNELVVRVIDPPRRRRIQGFRSGAPLSQCDIPTWKAGWYHNFGGLWQPVEAFATARCCIEDVFVQPQPDLRTVIVEVTVRNRDRAGVFGLSVGLAPRAGRERTGLALARTVRLGEGVHRVTFRGAVTGPRPWSPDAPFLYTATATLSRGGTPVDALAVTCGLRAFTVEDGVFNLNGRRIALRGFLQQGVYPRHLVFPGSRAEARRELRLLKDNGMNFVRAHLKPPALHLDLCDELGLLQMEEPPIGWIERSEHTLERCRREVRELVLRDRNRPSVVMWGLLNEATHYRTFTPAQLAAFQGDLSRLCCRLDPTRVVVDNSGGSLGSTGDNTVEAHLPFPRRATRLADLHAYCGIPLSVRALDDYRGHGGGDTVRPDGRDFVSPFRARARRAVGRDRPAVFVSEFGAFENPPDFERTLARYTAADRRQGLEDYAQCRRYYDSLRETFRRARLGEIFGSLPAYIRAAQDLHKENIRAIVSAMRANPRNSGWVFTQLADASGEIFGATDLWRQPRTWFRDMADACVTPLIVPHVTQRVTAPGAEIGLNVRLVNEDRTGAEVAWKVTVRDSGGRTVFARGGRVRTRGWVQEVLDTALRVPAAAGRCRVEAELRRGARVISRNAIRFTVVAPAETPVPRVGMFDHDNEVRPALEALGIPQIDKGGNNYRFKDVPIVFVMRPHHHVGLMAEYKNQLRRIVELGGAGLVLEAQAPMLHDELLPRVVRTMAPMRNLLYMRPSPIWDGLPTSDGFMDYEFADVLAGRACARNHPDDLLALGATSLAGGLCAHMWTTPDVYQWGSLVDRIPLGRGHLVLCQMQLVREALANPVAARLLSNLVRYTASLIRPGGGDRLQSRCIDPV